MNCDDKYNLIIENAKIRKKLNELGICGIPGPTGPSGAGVKNITEFHNAGYRGLYNGETANDIAKRKKYVIEKIF